MALTATPTLTEVNLQTVDVGGEVKLTGTSLLGATHVVLVSSVDKKQIKVAVTAATATEVTFAMPNLPPGGLYVYTLTPKIGYSTINITMVPVTKMTAILPTAPASNGALISVKGMYIPAGVTAKFNSLP